MNIPVVSEGAWARPGRACKAHFFRDGYSSALCGAYMTRDVMPSEFGTAADELRCPTCERKLGYLLGAAVSAAKEPE